MFITLTYRSKRWAWDDIHIDVHRYVEWLVRKLNIHARIVVGFELGDNTHLHLVLFAPDLTDIEHAKTMASVSPKWTWGRVKDVQEYDPTKGHAALVYTMGHSVIHSRVKCFTLGRTSVVEATADSQNVLISSPDVRCRVIDRWSLTTKYGFYTGARQFLEAIVVCRTWR